MTTEQQSPVARSSGRRLSNPLLILGAAVPLVFVALPLVALLWRTLSDWRHISSVETRDALGEALRLSAYTTAISLALVLLFGTPLAFVLARTQFRGKRLVDTIVDLPIVLPPAVAGIALLMAFGRRGVVGSTLDEWGIRIGFTTLAVVIAQCFVSLPFFVRSARAGFATVHADLEGAAQVDGATGLRTFLDITLPLAAPSLAAGAVLAWARALGEFGATIMFAGNLVGTTRTMPLAIYSTYESGDLSTALALGSILLVVSAVVLLLSRSIGSGPRYDQSA